MVVQGFEQSGTFKIDQEINKNIKFIRIFDVPLVEIDVQKCGEFFFYTFLSYALSRSISMFGRASWPYCPY